MLFGEFFRAASDQHHVFAVLQDRARQAYGIVYVFDGGDCAGFQRVAVHQDRVELHVAIGIQVRAVSSVEGGIVFQNYDGGFTASIAAPPEERIFHPASSARWIPARQSSTDSSGIFQAPP